VTVFAHDVADGDRVRRVAEGFDPADPWSRVAQPVPLPPRPRVGVLPPEDREFKGDAAAAALYDAAIARARALGWEIVTFDYRPFRDAAALLYAGPWVAEREAAVGDFIRAHADACDPTVAGIILGGGGRSARDAFDGFHRLMALKRGTEAQWAKMDVMLLPTAPTQYRVEAVQADPVTLNANLGLYTNFVNLLDLAAIAVPTAPRGDGLPGSVTLIGPSGSDGRLAAEAARIAALCSGGPDVEPLPQAGPDELAIAVCGAHMSGLPLNHQLTDRGARYLETTATAPDYGFFALPGGPPERPGLVRGAGDHSVALEIWALPCREVGSFLAGIPAPLGLGAVRLADGRSVTGFLCEAAATDGARDIGALGGWREYLATA
jgi:allophanate hydrolase